jgi:hypothetical protein
MTQALPFVSSAVIAVFALLVFRRYRQRGGTHLLLWGVGLVMFGVASFAEAYSALAWHPTVFRLWYLNGAILNAAWLGQGTVFLLARRRAVARALMVALAAASALAAVLVFTTPLDASRFRPDEPLSAQYREVTDPTGQVRPGILPRGAAVRRITPLFNIYGTVTLVGGALYSAWLLYRKEIVPQRVVGNILIAAGALSLAAASTLVRLGLADVLYLAELVAAVAMFAGFLLATVRVPAPAPAPAAGRAAP